MKQLIFVAVLFFAVNLFAQEKPKDNPKKTEIEQTYQTVLKKANDLKTQIYDAQKLIEANEKQIADYNKQMLELQQQYQVILDAEKKEVVEKK